MSESNWIQGEKLDFSISENENTFPKVLRERVKRTPHKLSMRKKDLGIWKRYTWIECWQKIEGIALGLVDLGLERGDKVCIIGDNDPEWFWAELAIQSVGGVSVGIYIDSIPEEIRYIVNHSEANFIFAKDQEQVDKFLEHKDYFPNIKKIIYWDSDGMRHYNDPLLIYIKDLYVLGQQFKKKNPDFFEQAIDKGSQDDLATFGYTSGTTGVPKGVMVPHSMLLIGGEQFFGGLGINSEDEYLSFVSPAWVAEQVIGISGWVKFGIRVSFAENPETVISDLREIGAHCFLFGPFQWESLLSMVQVRIQDTYFPQRMLYKICLPIGYKIADYALNKHQRSPIFWRFAYAISDLICFRPIRDYLGLKKLKVGLTAGSLLGPDTFNWFRAIGVPLGEVYGLSETTPITGHGNDIRIGTIGRPFPGVEIKISAEGEMLVKSPAMFKGYYKDPKATGEKVADGFLHTGDATIIKDGHVIFFDRVKDMLKLKGGVKYSPTYIENRLKFSPFIKDVMVGGNENEEFLYALMVIDYENVGKWAEKNRIPYTTYVDLSQKDEVYRLTLKEVQRVNTTLPEAAQVKKYVHLPKEFDADEGELTRTRKLKRSFLDERYGYITRAIYNGEKDIRVEAEVRYRDGRKGKITTTIRVMNVEG